MQKFEAALKIKPLYEAYANLAGSCNPASSATPRRSLGQPGPGSSASRAVLEQPGHRLYYRAKPRMLSQPWKKPPSSIQATVTSS